MLQYFICDEEEIKTKLFLLQEAGTSEDETETYFIDPYSKDHWILSTYESEELECDIQVLMKADVTSDNLIEIALTAEDQKTIAAAAMTLKYHEEHHKSEFRHSLIHALEKFPIDKLSKEERGRLRLIIYESDLYDGTNQKSITNKHWTEIWKDAEHYQVPANKAKKILEAIEQLSSHCVEKS